MPSGSVGSVPRPMFDVLVIAVSADVILLASGTSRPAMPVWRAACGRTALHLITMLFGDGLAGVGASICGRDRDRLAVEWIEGGGATVAVAFPYAFPGFRSGVRTIASNITVSGSI